MRDCQFRKAGCKKKATARIGLLTLLAATGCMLVRPARFVVPSRCVTIKVQSFTQPCQQHPDGKIVCNGVVITASCLSPLATPSGHDKQASEALNK